LVFFSSWSYCQLMFLPVDVFVSWCFCHLVFSPVVVIVGDQIQRKLISYWFDCELAKHFLLLFWKTFN
jgi:hypothetical protein